MTEAMEWQGRVGEAWAEEWRRTDRGLAPVGEAIVAAVEAQCGGRDPLRILDVGCGAGTLCFMLADRIGARVVGIDLAEPLVATARGRGEGRENPRFEAADASAWTPAGDTRFDAIVSRHGVMFFDDPVAAFAHLRGLAAPDARLVFSCFRARAENEWVIALEPVLRRFAPEALAAPPPAAGPFAFGDPAHVAAILTQAGFSEPGLEPFDFDMTVGAGADPLADAISYFQRIGPFARLLTDLDESRRAEAMDQLGDILSAYATQDGSSVRLRAAAWIVTARIGP